MLNTSRIHAYVKCTMLSLNNNSPSNDQVIYQRTAVHRNSSCPAFNQKFMFEIKDFSDYAKFIQIVVWHRDRIQK